MLIRVLLVDDHAAVRKAVRRLLERSGEIEVVGEAGGGAEAIVLVIRLRPDVVILDALMPRIDGFDVMQALSKDSHPPKIVMLSMNDTPSTIARAMESGASAFVAKKRAHRELVNTVKKAMGA